MKISLTIEGTYLVETKRDNYYITANNIWQLLLRCGIVKIKELFKIVYKR